MADSGCKVTVAAQAVPPNTNTPVSFTAAVWDNAAMPFYFNPMTPNVVTCANAGKYHCTVAFTFPQVPADATFYVYILVNGIQVLPWTQFQPGGKGPLADTAGDSFDVPANGTVAAQLVYQTAGAPPNINVAVSLSVIPGP